jgi:hypothetical protein
MSVPTATPATSPDMLTHALAYAAKGWAVFPVYEIQGDGKCACRGSRVCQPGKHPRNAHGVSEATTDAGAIRAWWRQWPAAGIGIATGARSGLVVVDVDPRNDGDVNLPAWEASNGALPPTATVLTGGGGTHLVFYGSGKFPKELCKGVDLKSDGGYIVAAPSLHVSGRRYIWDAGQPDEPSLLPASIAALTVAASTRPVDPGADVTTSRLYAAFAALGLIQGPCGDGHMAVRCPWEHEHTGGVTAYSSCVLYSPRRPGGLGGIGCSHSHGDRVKPQSVAAWLDAHHPGVLPPPPERTLSGVQSVARPRALTSTRPADRPEDWTAALARDRFERVVATPGNVALLLGHLPAWHGCVALDSLAGIIRWAADAPPIPGLQGPRKGDEIAGWHADYLSQWMLSQAGEYSCQLSRESAGATLDLVAHQHQYDPLVDWLSSLQWDGRGRLSRWLTTYLDAEDTPHVRIAGSRWLISAVARGLQHGCQADHALVLESRRHGSGKTTALRILGGDYYGAMPSLDDRVRAAAAVRGRWIIEIGELAAIRGRASEATKDFLTTCVDRYRPAYGRYDIAAPRSCVFAGTTNESSYLEDPTGSRRWWPVRIGELDRDALVADRDQLIAEAVTLYRNGEQWHPTRDEEAILLEQSSERYEGDPWTDRVESYLQGRGSVTDSELLVSAVGLDPDRCGRVEQRRITAIMTRLDWHRGRLRNGNLRPRGWTK